MSTSLRLQPLSGSSGRITAPSVLLSAIDGELAATWEITVRVNSGSPSGFFIEFGAFSLDFTSNRVRFQTKSGFDVFITFTSSFKTTLFDGQTHHVAAVFTANNHALYLDGSLVTLNTSNGNGSGLADSAIRGFNAFSLSDVTLQDFYIYDTALTQEQIINILQGSTTRSGFVYHWSLNNATEKNVELADLGLDGSPDTVAWNSIAGQPVWSAPRLTAPSPGTLDVSRATLLRDGRHLYVGPITLEGEPAVGLAVDKTKMTATIAGSPVVVSDAYAHYVPGVIIVLLESAATSLQEVVLTLGTLSVTGAGAVVSETPLTAINRAGQRMRGPADGSMIGWNFDWRKYWVALPMLNDLVKISDDGWRSGRVDVDGNLVEFTGGATFSNRIIILSSGIRWTNTPVRLSWEDPSDACILTTLGGASISGGSTVTTVSGNRKYRDYTATFAPTAINTNRIDVRVDAVPFNSSSIRLFEVSAADPANPDRPLELLRPTFKNAVGPALVMREIKDCNISCARTWAEINRTQGVSYGGHEGDELGWRAFSITAYENGSNTGMPHDGAGWYTVLATAANHGLLNGDLVEFGSGVQISFNLSGGGTTTHTLTADWFSVRVYDVNTFGFQIYIDDVTGVTNTTSVSLTGWRTGVAHMPISVTIDIVNDLDCDLWMCMTPTWTDECVQEYATYAAQNINRKFYMEGPNEAWNPLFPAYDQLIIFGHDAGISATRWLVRRLKFIWETFEAAFALEGRSGDFIRVLGGRAQPSKQYNNLVYDTLVQESVHCDYFNIAGYVGGELAGGSGIPPIGNDVDNAGSAVVRGWIFSEGLYDVLVDRFSDFEFGPGKPVRRGVGFYEWGPAGIQGSETSDTNVAAHKHPWIEDMIYECVNAVSRFAELRGCEVGPLAYFLISGVPDKNWGALNFSDQEYDAPASLEDDLSAWLSLKSSKMYAVRQLMKYRWQDIPSATSASLAITNTGTTFGDDHLRAFRNKIASGSQVEYTNRVDLIVDPAS